MGAVSEPRTACVAPSVDLGPETVGSCSDSQSVAGAAWAGATDLAFESPDSRGLRPKPDRHATSGNASRQTPETAAHGTRGSLVAPDFRTRAVRARGGLPPCGRAHH